MPFPSNKTIKELGIDTTRKFIVVADFGNFNKGDILELERDDNSANPSFKRISDNLCAYCGLFKLEYYKEPQNSFYKPELINPSDGGIKNKIMTLKEKFVMAFISEPEKSFRKAEITNGDGFLTEDGQKVFLGFLLKKHGEEFKKEVVDELLKAEEKK